MKTLRLSFFLSVSLLILSMSPGAHAQGCAERDMIEVATAAAKHEARARGLLVVSEASAAVFQSPHGNYPYHVVGTLRVRREQREFELIALTEFDRMTCHGPVTQLEPSRLIR